MTGWVALAWLTANAQAGTEIGARRPFGLGLQLGTFSGISGKVYLGASRANALDFSVGTGYGERWTDSFHLHVTYSRHFAPLASGGGVTIPWRVGIGGFANTGDYWGFQRYDGRGAILGARAPIGLDFDLEEIALQFYIEVAMNLTVIPGVSAGLDAGLGARYYF